MVKSQIREIQKKIKYRFKDSSLLELALTHPSFVQGSENGDQHNQRLEFLGDAVLDMIISSKLYQLYPDRREGFLTKARSTLCHGKYLTQMAKELGLEPYLQMGKGEQKSRSKDRSQVMGDCLEAIIGAVYLDGGYKSVRKLIFNLYKGQLTDLESDMATINHKGALQEWSQFHFGSNVFDYLLANSAGPDHAKEFTVEIRFQNESIAQATGFSKKEAESSAAEKTLKLIQKDEASLIAKIKSKVTEQKSVPES